MSLAKHIAKIDKNSHYSVILEEKLTFQKETGSVPNDPVAATAENGEDGPYYLAGKCRDSYES